jgi:hypothetical protein
VKRKNFLEENKMERYETLEDVKALKELYLELNSKTPDIALEKERGGISDYKSSVENNLAFAEKYASNGNISPEIDAVLTHLVPLERIVHEWRKVLV